ncbi:conserved hypothetical protein, partial [Streptomyces lividans TK24]
MTYGRPPYPGPRRPVASLRHGAAGARAHRGGIMTTTGTPTEPRYAWGRRGRHRRPRPRKVLLAAGGLALAAGALSVVRLLPGPGGDTGGVRAGAEPRVESGGRDPAPDPATAPAAG